MPAIDHNNRERKPALSQRLLTLGSVFLMILLMAGIFVRPGHSSTQTYADSSFTFTDTGDYGDTNNTTSVLQKIGAVGQSFNLALGDMNYDSTITPQQWSQYAYTNLRSNSFPFDIVAGDHDGNSKSGDLNDISALETDLPPNLPANVTITGTYGEQYYFDYPANNPLARFILVSPVVLGSKYNYNQGQSGYTWVSNAIDGARKNNIPWVIVGMAEGCIYISSPSDSAGCLDGDLFNLLVSKKVDLVLQAHLHYYARSYQLGTNNTTCTSIPTNDTFNQNCIANLSNTMTQGNGTVIVNTGTGGKSLISLNYKTDPNAGYFKTSMGSNENPTYGFSQFTISANQINMQYVPVVGSYKDTGFTINGSNSTPVPSTPSPTTTTTACPSAIASPGSSPSATVSPCSSPSVTASPSPSVVASPSPGTILAQDTFIRPNQTYWGKASDGQTWKGSANNNKAFSISTNTGLIVSNTSANYYAILGPPTANAEVEFTGVINNFSGATIGAILRWTDNQHWYAAYIDGTSLVIEMKVGGTVKKLGTPVAFAATAGISYTLLFSVSGSTLNASVWPTNGGTQPVNWMLTVNDSSLSSGNCGLHVVVQSDTSIAFTSLQATYQ